MSLVRKHNAITLSGKNKVQRKAAAAAAQAAATMQAEADLEGVEARRERKRAKHMYNGHNSAPKAAAAAAQQGAVDEEDHKMESREQQGVVPSASHGVEQSQGPAAAEPVDNAALAQEIKANGRHFAKIAHNFKFDANASSYVNWTVQFTTEMASYDLAHVLDAEANSSETNAMDVGITRLQQKTVYHMITHCVPNAEVRAVIATALPESERTGAGAWRALRTHFIGDQRAYLQSLESQFEQFRWNEGESWATLETRFETLVNDLAVVGVPKLQHQKQGRIMAAIQEAGRRDAQGTPVFARLNTTNQIKEHLSFREWLIAMRTEAQKIQDEHARKKSQKLHPRDDEERQKEPSQVVSFVGQSGGFGGTMSSGDSSRFDRGARGLPILCRNMMNRGRCMYGASCKFSHNIPLGGARGVSSQGGMSSNFRPPGSFSNRNRNGNSNGNGSSNGSNRSSGVCWEFAATGKCSRGASQCRFRHVRTGGQGDSSSNSKEAQFASAEVYRVASENIVVEADSALRAAHRVIGDSAASIHLTPRLDFIRNPRTLQNPISIRGAFGKSASATVCGDGFIPVGNGAVLHVPDMVYCESLQDTLLCLVKLMKSGHRFDLGEQEGLFMDRSSEFCIPISLNNDILTFQIAQLPPEQAGKIAEANATTRSMARIEPQPHAQEAAKPAPRTVDSANRSPAEPHSIAADADSAPQHRIPPSSALAHARYGHLCGRKLDQLIAHGAANGLVLSSKHASHKSLVANCDACMQAKMERSPFGKEIAHPAEAPNDMAVADVIGPITVQVAVAGGGVETRKFYISMITDVYSRHTRARVLENKHPSDEVIAYLHWSKIATQRDLKRFHTDGGLEYNRAERVLERHGVKVTRTPVHTPQWNAIQERKNRTTMEMARALLLYAGLEPDVFWQSAVETAVFLLNRVIVVNPHGKTALELFTGQKPDLSRLRVFGCDAFVRIADEHPHKLAARSEKGIFVGYDQKREGCYRVWAAGDITVSRDVRFSEQEFSMAKEQRQNKAAAGAEERQGSELQERIARQLPSGSLLSPESASSSSADRKEIVASHDQDSRSESESDRIALHDQDSRSESESDEESKVDAKTMKKISAAEKKAAATDSRRNSPAAAAARRSTRERKQAKRGGLDLDDFGALAFAVSDLPESIPEGEIRASEVAVPSTMRAMRRCKYAAHWMAAQQREIDSIQQHDTWSLVEVPASERVNIVSCKWVFAVKEKNGWVVRFKARLVARGFSQQYGVDYDETYSAVVRFKSLRVLLAVVAIRNLTLELMDVQTAYLNAPLKERVYMSQPEGFERGGPSIVCLLKKALYGLKQSGREWRLHLHSFLLSVGFEPCASDSCMYVKMSRRGNPILLCVYVDDIPAAFDECDREEWEEIKQQFAEKYKIKFLGEADWLLNMRISRDRPRKLLWLDQQSYVESMLEEFQLDEARSALHPGAPEELTLAGCPSSPDEAAKMAKLPYRRAIGLLTYLANSTRPDIAFAVNTAAQFSQNPGAVHWRAVQQILRYLCGTAAHALLFDGNMAAPSGGGAASSPLRVFADADWGQCKDTRRSTTGELVRLGECWIDWRCHKQKTVALSSAEAEYMALTSATQTALWVHSLLDEMRFLHWACGGEACPSVPLIFSDNKSAIAIAHTDALHARTKHIDIRHHFVREQVDRKFIHLQWIPTQEQVADILTKTLQPRIFVRFRDMLVHPLHSHPPQPQQQRDQP